MPSFTDEHDLVTFIGGIFEKAYQDPDLGPKVAKSGAVILIKCTEPLSEVVLDLPDHRVYPSAAACPNPTNVTMRMTTDVANRFWQGKMNLTIAIAKGDVKTDGAIMKVLRLTRHIEKLFPIYIDLLTNAHRQDLLIQ